MDLVLSVSCLMTIFGGFILLFLCLHINNVCLFIINNSGLCTNYRGGTHCVSKITGVGPIVLAK